MKRRPAAIRFRKLTADDMARWMERVLGMPAGELSKPFEDLQFKETPLMRLIRKRAK